MPTVLYEEKKRILPERSSGSKEKYIPCSYLSCTLQHIWGFYSFTNFIGREGLDMVCTSSPSTSRSTYRINPETATVLTESTAHAENVSLVFSSHNRSAMHWI
jgi:hypothetical protein